MFRRFVLPATCHRSSASGHQPPATGHLLRWLQSQRGDLVWNALVLVTVLLPLASLTLDVPRYFILRSRLQLAVDAAAEATAACVDLPHFQNTGEVHLDLACVATTPKEIFVATVQDLWAKGYEPSLVGVEIDEANDTVTVRGGGTTRLFFGLTPAITIKAAATSRFRMDKR